jgi:hypothetical protein
MAPTRPEATPAAPNTSVQVAITTPTEPATPVLAYAGFWPRGVGSNRADALDTQDHRALSMFLELVRAGDGGDTSRAAGPLLGSATLPPAVTAAEEQWTSQLPEGQEEAPAARVLVPTVLLPGSSAGPQATPATPQASGNGEAGWLKSAIRRLPPVLLALDLGLAWFSQRRSRRASPKRARG